jgi:hypothetical protein
VQDLPVVDVLEPQANLHKEVQRGAVSQRLAGAPLQDSA